MKALPWFRLYAEAVDDEKLRLLAFEDRWHFIALLCCKATGVLDGEDASMRMRKVAVKLGLDLRELGEVARRLAEVGLIEAETLQPLAWDQRQFRSDHDTTAADRQRLKRARDAVKETVTDASRVTHAHVTRSEQRQSRAETEETSMSPPSGSTAPTAGKEKPKPPPCPYERIVDAYHEALPTAPRVVVLTDQRREHIQARWRQIWEDEPFDAARGVELFRGYFQRVSKSKFLTGQTTRRDNGRPFVADLAWLVKAENFAKVIEGRYA